MKKRKNTRTSKGGLSKGDQLLRDLLKVSAPMAPDQPFSEFSTPETQSVTHDPVELAMKANPGLTREEAEEEIKALGF